MSGKVTKAAKKAPKKVAKLYKMPDPIKKGEILTDIMKKQWFLGHSIGVGGFGEIYCAAPYAGKPPKDFPNVIKIEPHGNGPLFCEMHFFMKNAKAADINAWKKEKKLAGFGMPQYLGSGSHEYEKTKYRFIVMDRYGANLASLFQENNKRFPEHTVYKVALQILDVLEYIHHRTYVHADIKGENLLLGIKDPDQVYLVDFGLACRYTTKAKYELDPKKAHNGTMEYNSRDGHMGVPTMRSDMEILAYNVIRWQCGTLPWEKDLRVPAKVQQEKDKAFENISEFLNICFPESIPEPVQKYMSLLATMKFNDVPQYDKFKKFFVEGLNKLGQKPGGKLDFKTTGVSPVTPKRSSPNKRKLVDRVVQSPRTKAGKSSTPVQNIVNNDRNPGVIMDKKRGKMEDVKQILLSMDSDDEYDIKVTRRSKIVPKPEHKTKNARKKKVNNEDELSNESEDEVISKGTRSRSRNHTKPSPATKRSAKKRIINVTASSEDMFED